MANRNFPNGGKLYSAHVMPVQIDGTITIGSTGAVSSFSSKLVASVTRLSAGRYQIICQDNYNSLTHFDSSFRSPVTGSAIPGGSFSAGTVYQIVSLGTTTTTQWHTAGVPAQVTPAAGVVFKAAGVGAGTGTVKAIGNAGISQVELMGVPSTMVSPNPAILAGSIVNIQCLGATDATTTTLIPTDPASGSVLAFRIIMNNSSVQ